MRHQNIVLNIYLFSVHKACLLFPTLCTTILHQNDNLNVLGIQTTAIELQQVPPDMAQLRRKRALGWGNPFGFRNRRIRGILGGMNNNDPWAVNTGAWGADIGGWNGNNGNWDGGGNVGAWDGNGGAWGGNADAWEGNGRLGQRRRFRAVGGGGNGNMGGWGNRDNQLRNLLQNDLNRQRGQLDRMRDRMRNVMERRRGRMLDAMDRMRDARNNMMDRRRDQIERRRDQVERMRDQMERMRDRMRDQMEGGNN